MSTTKTTSRRNTTTTTTTREVMNMDTMNTQDTQSIDFTAITTINNVVAVDATALIAEDTDNTADGRKNIIMVNSGTDTENARLSSLKAGTPAQKRAYDELKDIADEYTQAFKHYGMFACKIATMFMQDTFSSISKQYSTSNRKGELFCELIEQYIGLSRSTTKRAIRIGLTFLDPVTLECNPLIFKLTSAQTRVLSGADQKQLDRVSKAVEDGTITEDTSTDDIKNIAEGKTPIVQQSTDVIPSKKISSIGDSRKFEIDDTVYSKFLDDYANFIREPHDDIDKDLTVFLQTSLINKAQSAFKGIKLIGATFVIVDKIHYITMIVATSKSIKAITFTIDRN